MLQVFSGMFSSQLHDPSISSRLKWTRFHSSSTVSASVKTLHSPRVSLASPCTPATLRLQQTARTMVMKAGACGKFLLHFFISCYSWISIIMQGIMQHPTLLQACIEAVVGVLASADDDSEGEEDKRKFIKSTLKRQRNHCEFLCKAHARAWHDPCPSIR